MNYIHKLQQTVDQLREERAEALQHIIDLQMHLQTSKFDTDPTIQVGDVARWIEPIKMVLS